MNTPKVSICIPAYNQTEHLKKAIDSVLEQNFTDYEIVITDDSPGYIVKELTEQYNLSHIIKYFKNASTLGSPENWNEAIRKASGEYIKILHHDDWLNGKDSLGKFVGLLDDNPDADFAFSATQAISHNGQNWVHQITPEEFDALKNDPLLLCLNNTIGAPSTTIVRRNPEVWFDANLKWHVDIEYYLRQINNRKIIYSPELLTVTFSAEGRVSDECFGNKEVEVYEYFYLLNKIAHNKTLYNSNSIKKCILHAIKICNNHKVKNSQNVKNCGYNGAIPASIKTYFALNGLSTLSGRLYLKFLRR